MYKESRVNKVTDQLSDKMIRQLRGMLEHRYRYVESEVRRLSTQPRLAKFAVPDKCI